MADRQLKLYYFPSSFYSQKVLIALKEKEVKYEPVIVHIHSGEQNEAWYMRINPAGTVPCLQDGEKIIKESEDIVDYIDREFPTDSKLVPDMSTEMGKEVAKWRKILDEVPVDKVSFGVLCHPELSVSGVPKNLMKSKTEIIASFQINAKKLEKLADEHPDLREAYSAKIPVLQKQASQFGDEEIATKVLDDLEVTFDQVEEQLKKVEADPCKELWFCGQRFTAADINLCILMGRLDLMGLGERYHGDAKRPHLHAYWEQARKRPTVKRYTVNMTREMLKMKLKEGAKTALPIVGGLVTLGIGAVLAFLFVSKRQA